MKKMMIFLLALLMLAAMGCNLRNRQPSENFIPATHAPETTHEAGATNATEETVESTAERQLTRHSVRTVVSETGSYTDIYGRQWSYEFHLPFVDYPSIEASDCNAELERIYNKEIKEQLKLVDALEPMSVPYIDYECYYTGELVSMNVLMMRSDGSTQRSVYCFRSDGTMATNAEILKAVWVEETDFLAKVYDILVTKYVELNANDSHNVTYSKYYDLTVQQADDLEALSIYADEEDNLHVLAKMYDANGGVTEIEFRVKMK